ncbi:MAG: glycosyltransferase [Bacteroidales bacterium]|nr:glycosyltransferase [Bacteroidales bacterium]
MKVVHINKTEGGGGAAVAARRLHEGLLKAGIESSMLVEKGSRNKGRHIDSLSGGLFSNVAAFCRFVSERLYLLPKERSSRMRYNFSVANVGVDISTHPLVREADIIHLHWINQGFLSLGSLSKLFALGKPIFWTLHDMWSFTGGCHYAGTCLEYTEHCGFCPFLRTPEKADLSYKGFLQKREVYGDVDLTAVACSNWLGSCATSSALLRKKKCITIPNPIDTKVFRPMDKNEARKELGLPTDKKLLLFGAASVSDTRKGYRFLLEALRIISDSFPMIAKQIELVVFGRVKGQLNEDNHNFKTHHLDFISSTETLVKLYNAADVFVLPSLQDNLPNTVVESMSCGTPVVGFRTGGAPEMVVHEKTGYLAEVKNALSLAGGICSLLMSHTASHQQEISEHAASLYSEEVVIPQFVKAYEEALKR